MGRRTLLLLRWVEKDNRTDDDFTESVQRVHGSEPQGIGGCPLWASGLAEIKC
jgi:hypothetical protein